MWIVFGIGTASAAFAFSWTPVFSLRLIHDSSNWSQDSQADHQHRSLLREIQRSGVPRRWFCRCVAGVRNIRKAARDPLGSQTDGIPAGNARPLLGKEQDNE